MHEAGQGRDGTSSTATGRILILARPGSPLALAAESVADVVPLLSEHIVGAVQRLQSTPVDAVVVDAALAGKDVEAIRALKAATCRARLVLVAVESTPEARRAAQWVGAELRVPRESLDAELREICRGRPAPEPGAGRLLVIARPFTATARLAEALHARGYATVVLPSMEQGLSSLVRLVFDAVIVDHAEVEGCVERLHPLQRGVSRIPILVVGPVADPGERSRLAWGGAVLLPPERASVDAVCAQLRPPAKPRSRFRDTTRRVLGSIAGLFTRPR